MFNVNWGANPWLIIPKDKKWQDTTFIHCSPRRPMDPRQIYPNIDDAVFISQDESEYNDFASRVKPIKYFKPSSFTEMVVAISSCKLFIGGLSAPLAIAYASFTNCISQDQNTIDSTHFRNMNEIWTNFKFI